MTIALAILTVPAAQASSTGPAEALARERVASQRWDVGDGRGARTQPVAVRVGGASIPAAQASSSGRHGDISIESRPDSSSGVAETHNPGGVTTRAAPEPSRYLQAATQRLRTGVQERRSATWRHQDWLGQDHTKTAYRERSTRSRPYLRWIRHLWAMRAHRLWKLRAHTLRDYHVVAGSSAWHRAVEEAQHPYPGTSGWLLSCSSTEGGWGRWVPNSDGAPPGGWLQFYESTFWRMWATAKADVEARGYRVPASAASWYSPLGQALAGAWGLTNGRRHEWNSSGC